jgi:hypothetical protein
MISMQRSNHMPSNFFTTSEKTPSTSWLTTVLAAGQSVLRLVAWVCLCGFCCLLVAAFFRGSSAKLPRDFARQSSERAAKASFDQMLKNAQKAKQEEQRKPSVYPDISRTVPQPTQAELFDIIVRKVKTEELPK